MSLFSKSPFTTTALSATALGLMAAPALAQNFASDGAFQGSLCVGIDCTFSESFGFDTIRLKENNLRIKFQDTSSSSSFPSNDWEITANDSSNGGSNYLAITDVDAGRVPFRVEAGAQANTLVVESDGDVGIKTLNPVVDLHIVEGNSPTLRLEQDGSDGFTPQTWDMAGNEANFFIRDVTNGSILPLRVQPNTPDQTMFMRTTGLTINETGRDYDFRVESDINVNALYMDGATGNTGFGTNAPEAKLHVSGQSILIKDNGRVNFTLSDTSDPGPDFRTQLTAGSVRFSYIGTGAPEMELFQSGDLAISGSYISAGTTLTVPDYVFADDYDLRPLSEVRAFINANSHLPEVPSAAMIAEDGLDMTDMQMTLLKKVEELTLYTLAQQEELAALRSQLDTLSQN